ncbi:MAG: single-stranded DNA-binding protein [Bacteroidota bacterium]|nr:single-stranded DNA-binding protein [Bacteroidota bacterium]MDP4247924.1 single-stranded DNA-binding protein [Bacteroidota bacterium]
MKGKNWAQLVGYVGQHLKETDTGNGRRVAMRVATHARSVNELGEPVDKTVWHNVIAWDGPAEYAGKNFVKGSKIMVEGKIMHDSFQGKDGKPRQMTYIKAHSLLNLDR